MFRGHSPVEYDDLTPSEQAIVTRAAADIGEPVANAEITVDASGNTFARWGSFMYEISYIEINGWDAS